MKAPSTYLGVLLFDYRDPKKYPTKLTSDQKKLRNVTVNLLSSIDTTQNASNGHSANGSSSSGPPKSSNSNAKDNKETTGNSSNIFLISSNKLSKVTTGSTEKDKDKDKDSDQQQINTRVIEAFIHLFGLESSSSKDVNQLYKMYRFWQLGLQGKLITNKGLYKTRYPTMKSSDIQLIGMDNWRNVMCYLDALLVCLFYSSSSLDFLLDKHPDKSLSVQLQEEIEELKACLRFIVNLLRAGEHVPFTIIKQLCLILNSLGCDLALSYKQQDSLQLFEFLAECLSLPLITIKLDIIHSGKLNVKDDLRLIEERALLISVPTSHNYNRIKEEHTAAPPPAREEKKEEQSTITNTKEVEDDTATKLTLPSALADKSPGSNSNNTTTAINATQTHITPGENIEVTTKNTSTTTATPVTNKNDGSQQSRTKTETQNLDHNHHHHHHSDSHSEPPISLEECLNTYFNNSVTVKRHLDRKRLFDSISNNDSRPGPAKDDEEHASDLVEYAKMGIVTSDTPGVSVEGALYESIDGIKASVTHEETISSTTDLTETLSNSTIYETTSGGTADHPTIERIGTMGSIAKVSDRLEASRTRSSTIASVLNNAAATSPNISRKLTRRASSISNTEVSLPAWMFLQLLPYYTDPNSKLQFENHEEYYRRRTSRSKTLESIDLGPTLSNESPQPTQTPDFEKKFGDQRPIIPICLKRYVWDEKGHTHKIHRKVKVPQFIKYPYFIAEDRKKKGYVDFRRSNQNVAPFGSFMLVLESCVCHRGSSINSGHYVSLTRKHPYRCGSTEDDTWLSFNDLNAKGEKVKEMKFDEAMEREDPYILFYRIVDLDDESISEHASDDLSTIKPPKGGREKYWSNDSDSSTPITPRINTRKESMVSQISSLSQIPSQFPSVGGGNGSNSIGTDSKSSLNADAQPQQPNGIKYVDGAQSPEIIIEPITATKVTSNTATNEKKEEEILTSRLNNHFKHLGLGRSLSRSSSRARKSVSTTQDDEITPSDLRYIDVSNMFYWYDVDDDGNFTISMDYRTKPIVKNVSEDITSSSQGGVSDGELSFLDKLNSKLSTLKKTSTSTNTACIDDNTSEDQAVNGTETPASQEQISQIKTDATSNNIPSIPSPIDEAKPESPQPVTATTSTAQLRKKDLALPSAPPSRRLSSLLSPQLSRKSQKSQSVGTSVPEQQTLLAQQIQPSQQQQQQQQRPNLKSKLSKQTLASNNSSTTHSSLFHHHIADFPPHAATLTATINEEAAPENKKVKKHKIKSMFKKILK